MIAVASMIAIAERVRECRVQGATARVDTDQFRTAPSRQIVHTSLQGGGWFVSISSVTSEISFLSWL